MMNSSLIKLALLGTDAQPPELNHPRLAPFADVFANSENSVAKNAALAIGIETLIDQASPRRDFANGESPFPTNDSDDWKYAPLDVADAVLTVLDASLELTEWISAPRFDWTVNAALPIFQTFARYGLKFPPERATAFVNLFKSDRRRIFDSALIVAVAPPNVRELVKSETSLTVALGEIPMFLEPSDVPRGVTLDEIEGYFLDKKTDIPSKVPAFKAMRALAPDRARKAFQTLEDASLQSAWTRLAPELIPCMEIRLGENDAPFLKASLNRGGSSAACVATGGLLARLRDAEYLDSIVQYADSHMSRNGKFSTPNARARKVLQGLGLYLRDVCHRCVIEETLTKELFTRIPLEHWEEFFQASPEKILAKMSEQENSPYVFVGLRESFLLYGGPLRWEEPLDRLRIVELIDKRFGEDDEDTRESLLSSEERAKREAKREARKKEAQWFDSSLCRVDFRDTDAIRAAVDRLRAKDVAFPAEGLLAATRLALYEPYPWRDEFADFFDAALSAALKVFEEDDVLPDCAPISSGAYRFTLPDVGVSVRERKSILEKLTQEDGGCVAPIKIEAKGGNSSLEFARALWSNTLPILHLAPRRLRQKYSDLGKRFRLRCVDCSKSSSPRIGFCDELRGKLPIFRFERLYGSTDFSKAVEAMENYFLSLPRLE